MYGQKDMARALEFKDATFEIKAEEGADGYLTISGYGAVFGNEDSHGDIIEKGAFSETIKGRAPKMLWQHDPSQPIGVWDEFREDENGLFVKGRITQKGGKGAEAADLVEMGAIEGLSIGFRVVDFNTEDGGRFLQKLDLWEVSVVTFPSNQLANIYGMKSEDITKRDLERVFKDMGYSGTLAKAMSSGAWERREKVLREAGVTSREDDQREVDELKELLTEMLQK
jgi:HK97 family phage prohead protease